MRNDAERLYSAHPERLYVIGAQGLVAYKGGMGPFGYEPEELERWLARHSAVHAGAGPTPRHQGAKNRNKKAAVGAEEKSACQVCSLQ